jgi:hypothetical protein
MLDVADMAAREVDNEEVECIDGLPRWDKDIRRRNVWSERWRTTRDADNDGENDSIITTPIMKKIHSSTLLEVIWYTWPSMAIVFQLRWLVLFVEKAGRFHFGG